jgi:endonuclease-8
MPEGPEIKRSADAIAQVLEGHLIESADLHHDALLGSECAIVGQTVERIECRGKALLTHFSSGKTMYSHNQLYGLWRVSPRGKLAATNRALRIALHTDNHSASLYSATDISIWDTSEIEQHPFLQRLGPDLLAPETQADTVLALLEQANFKNRQLASLYLDQGFIAGNGNYLRSEILFFAGVNPLLKPR